MKEAYAVSIVMVRPDGQACKNEVVVWTRAEAERVMGSTWTQFRQQCMMHDAPADHQADGEHGTAHRSRGGHRS